MKNQTSYLSPFDGNYVVELAIPGYYLDSVVLKRIEEDGIIIYTDPLTTNEASLVGKKQKFVIRNIPVEFDVENSHWFWLNGLFIIVFKRKRKHFQHINRIKGLLDEMWEPWH